MENMLRYNRRSGYEPSDTENDWQDGDSPRRVRAFDRSRRKSPLPLPDQRRNVKSPYKPPRGDEGISVLPRNVSPHGTTYSDMRENVTPFSRSEWRKSNPNTNTGNNCVFSQSERRNNNASPFLTHEQRRRHASPYKIAGESHRWANHDYTRREASAPRERLGERRPQNKGNVIGDHKRFPSVGEINEMVANANISNMNNMAQNFESTDSISPGDIFFSRDYNVTLPKKGGDSPPRLLPKPPGYVDRHPPASNQGNKGNTTLNRNIHGMSQTTRNSSSGISRQSSSLSEASGRTSASARKFTENRRKNYTDTWLSCIKNGPCKTSNKSPDKDRAFDEASFIGKAIVVESLRPFWAVKHQPASLIGFTCHKQEAMLLQQLATSKIFPHILLKGPPGSGKKALTMALLRELYGDPVWNISHELRYIHILESRPMQIVVPLSLSPHHIELNVYLEPKAAYALTALVKQISSEYAVTPEISRVNTATDFKVLLLYDVDKAPENIQHLIKWIMDCYSDSCKLILCCEDDVDILESVKTRCKVIKVEAPVTHEVMEVLIQIAKKEGFELSMSFAAKIATKSKQNLRRAITALEACKAHNYPFAEDQPIPLGWEEALVELAADILADPSPKRLFIIRGKIQKLLADFVHPKLILLKLVEQFLHGVEANLKRELYYWYAYYDKRLPTGTSALLKLEGNVQQVVSLRMLNHLSMNFKIGRIMARLHSYKEIRQAFTTINIVNRIFHGKDGIVRRTQTSRKYL